jgi:hypothetical protein
MWRNQLWKQDLHLFLPVEFPGYIFISFTSLCTISDTPSLIRHFWCRTMCVIRQNKGFGCSLSPSWEYNAEGRDLHMVTSLEEGKERSFSLWSVILTSIKIGKVKEKANLSLCSFLTEHHAMKAYWGGGIAPRILDLGTRLRWVVSFTPRSLYIQGKSPWYPLDRRLGGPRRWSGRGDGKRNSQPPPGIKP